MSGRPALSFCFTWIGIPVVHEVEFARRLPFVRFGAAETGKIRPSMPMSPTCALFGMPPRAMTAQFSNSNGGMLAQLLLRPRQIAHDEAAADCARASSSSCRPHTSRSRFAMTRQAVGEISMPIHWRLSFSAATSAVPQPQKASSTMSFSLLLARDDAIQKGERFLRRITKPFLRLRIDRRNIVPHRVDGPPFLFVKIALERGTAPALG